jgi:hypothetical protein
MMWLAKGLSRQGGLMPDTRQGVGGPGQPTLESLAGDVLRVYAENLRLIERIRPDYEFEALYYWQPVVFWKKELSGDEVEVAKTYPQLKELLVHVRAGFVTTPLLSGAVPFRDLTGLFDDSPEPVFIDACHFSEASNQIMAREIARDLAPILDARAAASAP